MPTLPLTVLTMLASIQQLYFPTEWTLAQGLCEPETVIYAEARNELIVSNVCGFNREGKGYISRVSVDGELLQARWVENLNAPVGMAVRGGKLLVADIDRIHQINLATGVLETSIVVSPVPGVLNDIAVGQEGEIFATDSARHRLLRIRGHLAEIYPPDTLFHRANGIHIRDGYVYLGGSRLWRVDLATGEIKDIAPPGLGDIDGIDPAPDGGLSVSIVGGPVWHLGTGNKAEIWRGMGVSSANHAYVPQLGLVIVPTGYDNTLVAFRPKPEAESGHLDTAAGHASGTTAHTTLGHDDG